MIDSLQLGDKYKITTPANWKRGDKVIVHPSVQGAKVKELFGDKVETVYVSPKRAQRARACAAMCGHVKWSLYVASLRRREESDFREESVECGCRWDRIWRPDADSSQPYLRFTPDPSVKA